MARFIELAQDLYQGATWDLVLRVYNPEPPDGDGLPRSAVGLVVVCQIRAAHDESSQLLAEASTAAGTITTDIDGYIRIRISRDITAAMPFNGRPREWAYDVRIAEAGNAEPVRVWVYGPVNAKNRVST